MLKAFSGCFLLLFCFALFFLRNLKSRGLDFTAGHGKKNQCMRNVVYIRYN